MDAELKFKISGPEEYVPGGKVVYPDGEDDEPPQLFCEDKRRRGGSDLRWEAMARDSLRCRKCGKAVEHSTARIDHIIPVKRFASFQQAHRIEKLQTLCVSCHQEKTNEERHSQR